MPLKDFRIEFCCPNCGGNQYHQQDDRITCCKCVHYWHNAEAWRHMRLISIVRFDSKKEYNVYRDLLKIREKDANNTKT